MDQGKALALAKHLDAATPNVTSGFHVLAVIWSFLTSMLGGVVGTPEEKAMIEKIVKDWLDKTVLALMATNKPLALVLAGSEDMIMQGIDWMLNRLAPPPPPTPAPTPIVIPTPTGSAPPALGAAP